MYSLNGFLYINRDWNLYIPFLDLNYRSWRVFLIMCGVPSIVSAVLMILFLPESPKFTFSQGDEARTLKILQKIFKSNTGKPLDEYPVKSLTKDAEFEEGNRKIDSGFFSFMWTQTSQLFKHPHLKNTLTACYLQFTICVCGNGFFTFFPEIINKVFVWMDENSSTSLTVCEIIETFDQNERNITDLINEEVTCVTKLDTSVFINIAILSCAFSISWLLTSILVNRTGKLAIIDTFLFSGGIASTLLMFLNKPDIAIYLYFVLLLVSISMSVVNSSTVELYPTNMR